MLRKPPRLDHVKHVRSRGKWYSYFNTGTRDEAGKPVFARLPEWATPGFHDSYGALLAGRTRRIAPAYTLAHLAEAYRRSATFAEKAPNTQKLYRVQLAKVVEVWGKFPVNALEPHHVRRAIEAEGWKAGTRNMVVAVLALLYKWGRRQDLAAIDPARDMERARGGEHEPWPDDVLNAALAASDSTVRLAVHLLYFTGQRIGDVCKLRWGDIRDGHLFVRQTKTGKLVEPPLHAELAAELARTPKTGLRVLEGIDERRLRIALQAFTAALGHKTVPHGLRKNAVNALLEAGCTIAEVSAITGQTHQVVEHYAAKVNRRKLGKAAMLKFEQGRKASA